MWDTKISISQGEFWNGWKKILSPAYCFIFSPSALSSEGGGLTLHP
jgi:hypothetical protein